MTTDISKADSIPPRSIRILLWIWYLFPSLRWLLPLQAPANMLQQQNLHVPQNSFHMLEYYYPTVSYADAFRAYLKHAVQQYKQKNNQE